MNLKNFFKRWRAAVSFKDWLDVRQPLAPQLGRGVAECDALPVIDPTLLLRAIREATREAERWHALPQVEHGEDALEQVRQLRELHASLKRLDREQGIERARLTLAVRMRDIVKIDV